MHGNAMEWCFDLDTLLLKFEDGTDDFPKGVGAVTASERSLRGGAYYDLPKYVRTSNRYSLSPTSQLDASGFRIARTLKNLDAAPASTAAQD